MPEGSSQHSKRGDVFAREAAAGHPDVTICIPTWQAAKFIDRTLQCARNQTYTNIKILVSVDLCDDGTAQLCKTHTSADQRIKLFVQNERLGWAGNVNFLLDQVDTDYFFIYFHDDVIEPEYVETLLAALKKRPDAVSVHCDMGRFGSDSEGMAPVVHGAAYEGAAVESVLRYLLAPVKGAPLRSLIRRDKAASLRLTEEHKAGGFWAQHPFLLKLLTAGPALHVPQTLYSRWVKRDDGLLAAWDGYSLDKILDGFRFNTQINMEIFAALRPTKEDQELLTFALYVYTMRAFRQFQSKQGVFELTAPKTLSNSFSGIQLPPSIVNYSDEMQHWVFSTYAQLLLKEGRYWLKQKNWTSAAQVLQAAVLLTPDDDRPWRPLSFALRLHDSQRAQYQVSRQAEIKALSVSARVEQVIKVTRPAHTTEPAQ